VKLQSHSNKLDTNVENETQEFGIGDASVVIEILRNRLYQHKVRTLVQEYICNARDAMRESGKDNQFKVTVPNYLNPVFKVRDFGPGVSPERMKNVFIMYGSSTKRTSNNQTGGFGLGAKSAWSYTDSFTIVSVVDGIRRTYVAHTGVNNNGRLDLVSSEKTDEASGTEIQVAVKERDIEEFRNAVHRAIFFWDERPIVKGDLDVPTLVKGVRIGDMVEVIANDLLPSCVKGSSWGNQPLAVIDGIPYTIDTGLTDKVEKFSEIDDLVKGRLILHFGNGIVEVAASRESIADSEITINSMKKIAGKALIEVKTHISDTFGKVKTNSEYLSTYSLMSGSFEVKGFATFGDYSIEYGRIVSTLLEKVILTDIHDLDRRRRNKINKITKSEMSAGRRMIDVDQINNLFYLTKEEPKLQQNKRIREYLKTNKSMLLMELGQDKAAFDQVIKDLNAKDFHAITYTEAPKVAKVKVERENEQICLHQFSGNKHKYVTLAGNTQKWLYVPVDQFSEEYRELDIYFRNQEEFRICALAHKALSMVQDDANFSPLKDWLDAYKADSAAINYAKRSVSINCDEINILDGINGIRDKFLTDMIAEYEKMHASLVSNSGKRTIPEVFLKVANELPEVKDFMEKDGQLQKLIKEKYALLLDFSRYSSYKEELVFYINAKYEANKGVK